MFFHACKDEHVGKVPGFTENLGCRFLDRQMQQSFFSIAHYDDLNPEN